MGNRVPRCLDTKRKQGKGINVDVEKESTDEVSGYGYTAGKTQAMLRRRRDKSNTWFAL